MSYSVVAEENNCSKYDKLSKDYAKCNTILLKKKTIELKIQASDKIDNTKKKFATSNLKKKLLKFKNSKTHKEYKEN